MASAEVFNPAIRNGEIANQLPETAQLHEVLERFLGELCVVNIQYFHFIAILQFYSPPALL